MTAPLNLRLSYLYHISFGISAVVSALGSQPSGPGSISGQTESVTITLSRHLYASPLVGHARRIRPVLKYRITDLEA